MKNLRLLAYLFLGATIILTAPSCGTDEPIVLGPIINITNSPSADVAPATNFEVEIEGIKGDAPLKSLTVYEDGIKVELSRLQVDGSPAGANPKLILGTAVDGFTWTVTILAHPGSSTKTYSFELADDDGETDETSVAISTTGTPPSLTLNGSNMVSAGASTLQGVSLSITAGTSPLSTIAVYADGTLMAASELRYKDAGAAAVFTDNPMPFPSGDKDLFNDNIYIRTSSLLGIHTYTIEVTDESGQVVTADLVINVGTAVDMEFTAVIVNNADGPVGSNGGLDLDNGMNVPAASPMAEIRDRGIDLSEPDKAKNWYQQLRGVNGASLRRPDTSQPEAFDYDAADTKEAIIAAWDAGTAVTDPVANKDDVFIVKRNEDYFLIKITDVQVTANDNLDKYTLNVKQALK